jgi:LPS-assembly protein
MVLYGAPTKPGISAGLSFYYDVSHSLLQGSTAQVSYNSECYGLSFEFTQYDIGARKESRFRFALTLKNLGSVGTLRRQERLF